LQYIANNVMTKYEQYLQQKWLHNIDQFGCQYQIICIQHQTA